MKTIQPKLAGCLLGIVLVGLFMAQTTPTQAGDWPQIQGPNHSGVLSDANVCAISRRNGVFVFAAQPEFEIVAQNKLVGDDPDFNATLAPAGWRLFLRSNRNLYCIVAMQAASAGN